MREWSLGADAPLSLIIAADARLIRPNYVDDQIWELRIGGGEPSALALETSYGRRARSMRIFAGFRIDQDTLLDPARFHRPPEVRLFLPNYLRLEFSPFPELQVSAEYWVAESNLVGGRLTLTNQARQAIQPALLLHAVLHPAEHGQTMTSAAHQGAMVLMGATGELAPLVFLSGGASAAIAPYPALQLKPVLSPGASESFSWAHSALPELDASFQAARRLVALNWDAEIARVERANSGLVEIETGDPDWDAALAAAQTISLASFVGPTRLLPHPASVQVRTPAYGHSGRADGRDYDIHWNGLTAGHALLNALQIVPVAPELAEGVVLNFLAAQNPDGSIDWKPGLGGQRNGAQSIPLLCSLAWRIYQHTEDRDFLARVYPRLTTFVESWFGKRHDRDQDGYPEWDHTLHSGFDDWPSFVRWRDWGQGLDLSYAETPDLAAYLLREISSLLEMERVLELEPSDAELPSRQERLRLSVEETWSDAEASYLHRDRELHASLPGRRLGSGKGEFSLKLTKQLEPPSRLLFRIHLKEGERHAIQIFVHGRGRTQRKRIERLTERRFSWFGSLGTATTDKTYTSLDRIEVRGIGKGTAVEIRIPDFRRQDQSGLLPLWAGVPDAGRAARLVQDTVLRPEKFWREFGITSCSAQDRAYRAAPAATVWMLPNVLIGEGLVDYGYLEQAAELVGKLLRACIASLHEQQATREAYSGDRPGGVGERGHSAGIAPVSLLLYVLGVRLITPTKLALRGHNPFPWPINLRWRGVAIRWEAEEAHVRFPDGGEIRVAGRQIQTVEQVPQVAEAILSGQ